MKTRDGILFLTALFCLGGAGGALRYFCGIETLPVKIDLPPKSASLSLPAGVMPVPEFLPDVAALAVPESLTSLSLPEKKAPAVMQPESFSMTPAFNDDVENALNTPSTIPLEFRPALIEPGTDWGFSAKPFSLRNAGDATVTNYFPATLNIVQPLYKGAWSQFRPTVFFGAGMLAQSSPGHQSSNERDYEVRPLLHAGFGAEWSPDDFWIFNVGYEYFRLPEESAMNPDYPTGSHNVWLGVQVRF